MIFPADVNASQLRAFLKLVYASEGVVHVHTVATELHMDLTKLLPVLDAAEMLGLVKIKRGEIRLSEEAPKMFGTRRERVLAISEPLSKVEPFVTALKFKERFTGEDVAKELSKKGIRWHHEDEVNTLVVTEILTHWGIHTGLVDYDGSGFTPKIRSDSSS